MEVRLNGDLCCGVPFIDTAGRPRICSFRLEEDGSHTILARGGAHAFWDGDTVHNEAPPHLT